MKKIIFMLVTAIMLFASGNIYAQSSTNKITSSDEPTPANVLKWTKEVLPKMEALVPKLEKIKAANPGKPASDVLHLLATVNQLKEIKKQGTKLKAAEARRYYDLIAATVNSFYIDCKSKNGNVCCVDCHNHGILGIWCFANCFVIRFPGID
ncbi:MAG: hypothetical protein ABJA37_08460 [Ferruginibacter sp.]